MHQTSSSEARGAEAYGNGRITMLKAYSALYTFTRLFISQGQETAGLPAHTPPHPLRAASCWPPLLRVSPAAARSPGACLRSPSQSHRRPAPWRLGRAARGERGRAALPPRWSSTPPPVLPKPAWTTEHVRPQRLILHSSKGSGQTSHASPHLQLTLLRSRPAARSLCPRFVHAHAHRQVQRHGHGQR